MITTVIVNFRNGRVTLLLCVNKSVLNGYNDVNFTIGRVILLLRFVNNLDINLLSVLNGNNYVNFTIGCTVSK